jgi:hypothetical protein
MIRFFCAVILPCFFITIAKAQHCPFDGMYIVILKTSTAIKKNTTFYLKEIENNTSDSCTYAKGLIQKKFLPMDSLYTISDWMEDYEKKTDVSIKQKGNYFVKLNMAEVSCMLKKGNNFSYNKRKFLITYKQNGTQKQLKLKQEQIYGLCTSNNNWQKIPVISL